MKVSLQLLATLVCLGGMVTGCRTTRDNQIDILERELRAQEDYIYELENYVVEYSEKLREYRCSSEPGTTTKIVTGEPELAAPPLPATTRSSSTPAKPPVNPPQGSRSKGTVIQPAPSRTTPELSPELLEAPELELEIGEPMGYEEELQASPLPLRNDESAASEVESFAEPEVEVAQAIPAPAAYYPEELEPLEEEDYLADAAEVGSSLEDVSDHYDAAFEDPGVEPARCREPENLVITHVFADSTEGTAPSSLLTVIEARDAINEPADVGGAVSVMVMTSDPQAPQRIKRWDFTAEETAAAWQTSTLGDGLHLELPLDRTMLPEEGCELWVRLVTADGRKLLSQRTIDPLTLASLDQTEEQLAAAAVERTRELAANNPLRAGSRGLESATPLPKPVPSAQPESQWRAATHFSSAVNSGFATTAKNPGWAAATPGQFQSAEKPAASASSGPQWTARK